MKKSVFISFLTLILIFLTGCSSVFNAGISGKIVDSESTSTPKEGIQDVEVFAYTKEKARDQDFENWDGTSRFSPTTSKYYIGHATTNSSGEFTISKIVWESFFPEFGKTADYCEVFLLFYHDEFGLEKNSNIAMVMSDATSNIVYQEMTKIKKKTTINLTITNVANNNLVTESVIATIKVPQDSANSTYKTYTETITSGTAAIPVLYSRYQTDGKTTFEPTIKILLSQNGNNQKFKQCNCNNGDYSFTESALEAQISGDSCPIESYMKAYKIAVPTITGTYGDTSSSTNDGKRVVVSVKGEEKGNTTTYAQTIGTDSGVQTHGNFSISGEGYYWEDTSYTTATTSADISFTVDGSAATSSVSTISSSDTSINVTLQ